MITPAGNRRIHLGIAHQSSPGDFTGHPRIDGDLLARRLRSRGRTISAFPQHLRVVIMPNHDWPIVEQFLEDLAHCAAIRSASFSVRTAGPVLIPAPPWFTCH